MPSNIDFDPELLAQVQELGGFRYKKDALNAALEEFINRRKQKEVIQLFGKVEYDPEYDYKKQRKRK